MRQYCSVCKGHYEMTVVRESAEDGVIWLKCPHCQGILPHMPDSDSPASGGAAAPGSATDRASSVATADRGADGTTDTELQPIDAELDFDIEAARPYQADESYDVGNVIHHRGWNDYGVVVSKSEIPGNRQMIRVRFVESGEVQLIEDGR